MEKLTDRALVRRTRDGEVEAFGELVRRYQNSVFNVCYRLLGERRESEDLSQEAFIRAFQRLGTYDPERPFGPWIRRVAMNLCYNHLKSQKPAPYVLQEERDLASQKREHNPEQSHQARAQADTVRAAILSLPPQYRAVIELRHYHDLSYAEISAELDMSISQVKSNLFRARKSLASILNS